MKKGKIDTDAALENLSRLIVETNMRGGSAYLSKVADLYREINERLPDTKKDDEKNYTRSNFKQEYAPDWDGRG